MSIYPRSIDEIFNNDSGKEEIATTILNRIMDNDDYVRLRRLIRIRNKDKNPLYKCGECGTELELSCMPDGNGEHSFFFKHIKDPQFILCSVKTNSDLSKDEIQKRQYLFKSESNAHILLKKTVGEIVRLYVSPEVIIDKKYISDKFGDKEKRKPDIYFEYKNRAVTIEFQINNTFHSVIQEREAFYERNQISLIWVFGEFNPESFQSISVKDIYIPNGNNAFVFDYEVKQTCQRLETLCLKVYYKQYSIKNEQITYEWANEIITIDQIQYNQVTLRPYFFDCINDKIRIEEELKIIIQEQKIKSEILRISRQTKAFKEFLTKLKNNDNSSYELYLMKASSLSPLEAQVFNDELNLNKTFKDKNNTIQLLLEDKIDHYNLLCFLLKSNKLDISIESVNKSLETTFISLMRKYSSSSIRQLLFSRGYRLHSLDNEYIQREYSTIEQKRFIFEFRGFEKLLNFNLIHFFSDNLNEFLVIESAKIGKLSVLGNENQSLIWMANLAADKYQRYWYYFDKAFSFYSLYEKLFRIDSKGTFKKKYESLATIRHQRNSEFEEIISILYPELNDGDINHDVLNLAEPTEK
jgi:hypothetical protein